MPTAPAEMDAAATKKIGDFCRAEAELLAVQQKQKQECSGATKKRRFCLEVLSAELHRLNVEKAVAMQGGADEVILVTRKKTRSARPFAADEWQDLLANLEASELEKQDEEGDAPPSLVQALVRAATAPFFVEKAGGVAVTRGGGSEEDAGASPSVLSEEMGSYALCALVAGEEAAAVQEKYKAGRKKAAAAKKAVKGDVLKALKMAAKPVAVRVRSQGGADGAGGYDGQYNVRCASKTRTGTFGAKNLSQAVKRFTTEWLDANSIANDGGLERNAERLMSEDFKEGLAKQVMAEMERVENTVREVDSVQLVKEAAATQA